MKFRRSLLAAVVLALLALANSASAQVYQGKQLVEAELLADTTAVVPGKPFLAGLRLKMAPGWHTYWQFSGDAGLPTETKWNLPAGWKVDEIAWPLPHKMLDPGDIETYGYADEVLLMQLVTPPANLSEKSVDLTMSANWLVCERLCIPGNATLHLTLPVAATAEKANENLFLKYRKQVPRPDLPTGQAWTVSWERTGNELRATATSKAFEGFNKFDFFPLPDPKVVIGHPAIESHEGGQLKLKIPLESADPNVTSIDGVLVLANASSPEERAGWMFDYPGKRVVKKGDLPHAAMAPRFSSVAGRLLSAPSGGGLLTFLFYGFLGGLILNLMPCVLPVISLKIFGFVQQAGQSRAKIFRSGLVFTAGIFAWFIGLALLLIALKSGGRQISWALQFTNPYFVLGMSVVVLIFALNLFGVFEINLPQFATRGLLGATGSEGDAASFFQGVFATILATPCTAPFLGTALGFAFTQSGAVIFAMFVSIAFGMALPYLLLSAQPAWLRFLPKPGPWMVHVKQFMGFLLIATLLFLLYVLGAQRGLEAVTWASCFLLVIAIVCWMKGTFMTPVASGRARFITAVIAIALLIWSGIYFINGKFRAAPLPSAVAETHGDWKAFTPEKLEAELNQGHTVFVDFTAAWCLTCKFNEARVLESSAVREAFQRKNITKFKADWTNGDPAITKILQHFGRPGVPLYVLYRGKSEEPVVFPELLTQGIILEKLETVAPAVAAQ